MNKLPKELETIINHFKEDSKFLDWKFLYPIYDYDHIVLMRRQGGERELPIKKITLKNIDYFFDKMFAKSHRFNLPSGYKSDLKDIKRNLKLIYLYDLVAPKELEDFASSLKYNKDYDLIRISPLSKKWSGFVHFLFMIASDFKAKFKNDKEFKEKVHKKIASWIAKSDLGKLIPEKGILTDIAKYTMGGRKKQCSGKTKSGKRCKNKCLKKRCHLHN